MAPVQAYETDEVPVTFPVGGRRVVGMFHRPVGVPPPYPAVVIFHGFTGNKMSSFRKFVTLGRRLAGMGLATLRFDYRGCGDSEGAPEETSIESELADARAAVAWLRQCPEIDAARLGVLGVSLGGLIAALILAEDESLRVGCLWAAVSRPDLQLQIRNSPALQAALEARGTAEVDGFAVGRAFIEQLQSQEPLRHAAATRHRSIFLLHGEKDASVPVSSVWEYEQAYRRQGNEVKVHVIAGADHRYSRLAWQEEVVNLTAEWFRATLIDQRREA